MVITSRYVFFHGWYVAMSMLFGTILGNVSCVNNVGYVGMYVRESVCVCVCVCVSGGLWSSYYKISLVCISGGCPGALVAPYF